jgi:hypothetical protein
MEMVWTQIGMCCSYNILGFGWVYREPITIRYFFSS